MTVSLRHYACGSTYHDMHRVFRGAPRERRVFPSGVFLYQDDVGRRVLFDTGYETGSWDTGWKGAVYRRLLPVDAPAESGIGRQLEQDGISPSSITHVVLSHLHPDHIGGARLFPQARFVLTEEQTATLAEPRMKEGLLLGLLPGWFPPDNARILTSADFVETEVRGVRLRTVDLFDDGRYLVIDLPGHARGHIGALVGGRVLLAGDAAWGVDAIEMAPRLRALPRAIQHDVLAYVEGARMLAELADAGIRVVCSHDPVTERELI